LSNESDAKPFRMLAIYDSEEASREATQTSNLVLRELGDGILADRSTWNLQSLNTKSVRALAAEEAARADVIVIALAGKEPSATLKKWTAEWQSNRELSGGLLALVSPEASENGGNLADFLYETAVTAHMDFPCQKKNRH
jgi:hypothetical protein